MFTVIVVVVFSVLGISLASVLLRAEKQQDVSTFEIVTSIVALGSFGALLGFVLSISGLLNIFRG